MIKAQNPVAPCSNFLHAVDIAGALDMLPISWYFSSNIIAISQKTPTLQDYKRIQDRNAAITILALCKFDRLSNY